MPGSSAAMRSAALRLRAVAGSTFFEGSMATRVVPNSALPELVRVR